MIVNTAGMTEERREKAVADALAVKSAILIETKKARSIQGEMTCPICHTGRIGYSVASNGHIWARCATKDCVRFME